jgi:predicted lipid carrier protein YhbT
MVQRPHPDQARVRCTVRGGDVASKTEVEKQLQVLLGRLAQNHDSVRSAIPERKVLRCHVTDLDTVWYAVIEAGQVSAPSETPPDDGRVDITLRVGSDDLVDLIEGRRSFLSAFTSGKVKVDASIIDLLRLRALL